MLKLYNEMCVEILPEMRMLKLYIEMFVEISVCSTQVYTVIHKKNSKKLEKFQKVFETKEEAEERDALLHDVEKLLSNLI